MKTKLFSSIFLSSFILMAIPAVASAQWADPGTAPTGNNAQAPVNVGYDNQVKSGGLIITGGLSVAGSYFSTTPGVNVGVGFDPSATPSDALDVNGNIVVSPTTSGGTDGNVYAAAFYYTSDERLKENIEPLQNSLSTIEKLQGVSFDWKKNQKPAIGFIAQDVSKVLPQIVSTDGGGYEAVSYASVVPILVEAVKEQQQEIQALQAQVKDLENK